MAASKEELRAKAEELGLEVTRADGQAGEPLVTDYERVLTEHGAGIPENVPAPEGGGTKTYVVHGPYRVFGARRGEEVTGEVRIHKDTGAELLIVGADHAVLAPLIEAGWLVEKGA